VALAAAQRLVKARRAVTGTQAPKNNNNARVVRFFWIERSGPPRGGLARRANPSPGWAIRSIITQAGRGTDSERDDSDPAFIEVTFVFLSVTVIVIPSSPSLLAPLPVTVIHCHC
jgi:hypothetical protein